MALTKIAAAAKARRVAAAVATAHARRVIVDRRSGTVSVEQIDATRLADGIAARVARALDNLRVYDLPRTWTSFASELGRLRVDAVPAPGGLVFATTAGSLPATSVFRDADLRAMAASLGGIDDPAWTDRAGGTVLYRLDPSRGAVDRNGDRTVDEREWGYRPGDAALDLHGGWLRQGLDGAFVRSFPSREVGDGAERHLFLTLRGIDPQTHAVGRQSKRFRTEDGESWSKTAHTDAFVYEASRVVGKVDHPGEIASRIGDAIVVGGDLADPRDNGSRIERTYKFRMQSVENPDLDRALSGVAPDVATEARAVVAAGGSVQVLGGRVPSVVSVRQTWAMLDIDGAPVASDLDGAADADKAIQQWMERHLPLEFNGVETRYQLSSSAGMRALPDGRYEMARGRVELLHAHPWVRLDRPAYPTDVAKWVQAEAKRRKVPVDVSVLASPQQPHFVAPPTFQGRGGIRLDDPLAGLRSGRTTGTCRAVVLPDLTQYGPDAPRVRFQRLDEHGNPITRQTAPKPDQAAPAPSARTEMGDELDGYYRPLRAMLWRRVHEHYERWRDLPLGYDPSLHGGENEGWVGKLVAEARADLVKAARENPQHAGKLAEYASWDKLGNLIVNAIPEAAARVRAETARGEGPAAVVERSTAKATRALVFDSAPTALRWLASDENDRRTNIVVVYRPSDPAVRRVIEGAAEIPSLGLEPRKIPIETYRPGAPAHKTTHAVEQMQSTSRVSAEPRRAVRSAAFDVPGAARPTPREPAAPAAPAESPSADEKPKPGLDPWLLGPLAGVAARTRAAEAAAPERTLEVAPEPVAAEAPRRSVRSGLSF